MLDNVIDISRFPLPAQKEEAHKKRRIGLGVTGLADALIMCSVRYGSIKAVDLTDAWMKNLRDAAYRESSQLANEKVAFQFFEEEAYMKGPNIKMLPKDIQEDIKEFGIRNALLTSIAPTGTISLLADNVSSGVEPVFAFNYERAVLRPDGSKSIEPVHDYAYQIYLNLKGDIKSLPGAFVSTHSLRPEDHLVMQSTVQKYIDSSISSTVNLAEETTVDTVADIYMTAYKADLKGITVYREGSREGILITDDKSSESEENTLENSEMKTARMRPSTTQGKTRRMRTGDGTLYVTVNEDENGLCEVFTAIGKAGGTVAAQTEAISRLISLSLR